MSEVAVPFRAGTGLTSAGGDSVLDAWTKSLSLGYASGQILSTGLPAVGVWSFIRSAYHNRGDGLPRALSSAYQASRGAIRGAYDLSGWLMNLSRGYYPNHVRAADLGFIVGLTTPFMNVFPFYAGFRHWRSGRRLRGALEIAAGLGMTAYDIHSTMGLMRKTMSIGAGMGFRTGGAATNPPGSNVGD